MVKIDARLAALYDEYVRNGKEEEFLMMLYSILDTATEKVREAVRRKRRAAKIKANREDNKSRQQKIKEFYDKMSPADRIDFLNKPWDEQPEWVKEELKDLVRYPEEFNFLRIVGAVPEYERQQETCGARIVRYMEANRFVTGSSKGLQLDYKRFADVCNDLAVKYDLARRPGHKAQRVRITVRDLLNYTQYNVTPKKDKLAVIAVAMDLPVTYLGGYGDDNPPVYKGFPMRMEEINPNLGYVLGGKFRKNRGKKSA